MIYLSEGISLSLPNNLGALPQPTTSNSWTLAFYLGIGSDAFSLPASIITESAGAWGIGLDTDMSLLIWLDRIVYDTNYVLFRQAVIHAERIPNLYHLSLVYDNVAPSFSLYVNSILVRQVAVATQASTPSANPIYIARKLSGVIGNDFDGYFDQLYMWSAKLTATQLYGLVNTSAAYPAPNFSWSFDQSLGCLQSSAQNAVAAFSGTSGLSYIDSPLFLFFNLDAGAYGSATVTLNAVDDVPLIRSIQALPRLNTRGFNTLTNSPSGIPLVVATALDTSAMIYRYTNDSTPYSSPDCPFDIVPYLVSDPVGTAKPSALYVASNRNYDFSAPVATPFLATIFEDYNVNVITLKPLDLDYLLAPKFGMPDLTGTPGLGYLTLSDASFSISFPDTGSAISFWFSPGVTLPAASYNGYTIITFCSGSFSFTMSSAGVMSFTGGSVTLTSGTTVFNHDRWYHIQYITTATHLKGLFINGYLTDSSSTTISTTTLSNPRIGAHCSSPQPAYGMRLVDLRVGPNATTATYANPLNPRFPLAYLNPATYNANDRYLPLSSATLSYTNSLTGLVAWGPFNVPSCRIAPFVKARITQLPSASKGTLYQTPDGVTKGAPILLGDYVTDSLYRVIYDVAPAAQNVYGSGVFDWFNYTAWDGITESSPAMVSINVSGTPDFPRALNLAYSVSEYTRLNITLNVSSPDLSPVVAVIPSLPALGTLYKDAALTIPLTAGANISSPYVVFFIANQYTYGYPYTTFTFYALDNTGRQSGDATVTINVTFVNNRPIGAPLILTTSQLASLSITIPCEDPDLGQPCSVVFFKLPTDGSQLLNVTGGALATNVVYATQTFTFQAGSAPGTNISNFTYACFSSSQFSAVNYTVVITILPFNIPPTAVNLSFSISEGSNVSICMQGDDPDSLPALISFQIGALPTSGSILSKTSAVLHTGDIVANNSRCVTFVPNPYTWTSTGDPQIFTYRAYDGQKYSDWAFVLIDIMIVDTDPIALPVNITLLQDSPMVYVQLLGSDPNRPSSVLEYSLDPYPACTFALDGFTSNMSVVCPLGYTGSFQFSYVVFNPDTNRISSNLISVVILNVNDPPTGTNLDFNCVQDALCLLSFNSTAVSSPESYPVQIEITSRPLTGQLYYGSLEITTFPFIVPQWSPSTINVSYLTHNLSPSDAFTYQVIDRLGTFSISSYSVSISIQLINAPPIALNAQYTTKENTALFFYFNMTDEDSAILSTTDYTWNTSLGTLSTFTTCSPSVMATDQNPQGTLFTFCPTQDYFTSIENPIVIQFNVIDNQARKSVTSGNVSIFVAPVNQPPTALPLVVDIWEGSLQAIALPGADPENPSELKAVILTLPSGAILYRDFLMTDPIAAGTSASLTIYILSIDNFYQGSPNNGSISVTGFRYSVFDPQNLTSAVSNVTINIHLIDAAPVAFFHHYDFNQSSLNNVIVLNGTDPDSPSSTLTYAVTSLPAGSLYGCYAGSCAPIDYRLIKATDLNTTLLSSVLYYSPVSNALGSPYTTFQFRIQDNEGVSSSPGTIEISLRPVDYPPTALPLSYTILDTQTLYISLDGADDYTPNSSLVFYVIDLPTPGVLYQADEQTLVTPGAQVASGNLLVYRPPITGTSRFASFRYYVVDGLNQVSTPGTVSITINPSNHAPVASSSTITVSTSITNTIALIASDLDSTDTLIYFIQNFDPSTGLYTDTNSVSLTPLPYSLPSSSFRYKSSGFTGVTLVRFRVFDGTTYSNDALVYIIVTGPNQPPVPYPLHFTCNEQEAIIIQFNATDVDDPTGNIRYWLTSDVPAPSYLNSTVQAIPVAPVTVPGFIDGGTSASVGSEDLQQLYFQAGQGIVGPTTLTFGYQAYSGGNFSASSVVSIDIVPTDQPPVAYGSYQRMIQGQDPKADTIFGNGLSYVTITIDGYDVDTPPSGRTGCITTPPYDPLTGLSSATGAYGWLVQDDGFFNSTIYPNASCVMLTNPLSMIYVASPGGFLVTDRPFTQFDYTLFDGNLYSPPVTYRIFIAQTPHPPNISSQFIVINESTPYQWIPQIYDPDFAVNPPKATIFILPTNGTLSQNIVDQTDNGPITKRNTTLTKNALYTPPLYLSDYYDSWIWYATDETGRTSEFANVTIYVTPVNNAPVVIDHNYQVILGRYVDLPLLSYATDVDSTNLSIEVVGVPFTGTLYILNNISDPYATPILCCGLSCLDPLASNCTFTPITITSPNATLRFAPGPNVTETLGAFAVMLWRATDGLLYSLTNATAQIDLVQLQPPVATSFPVTTTEDHNITFALQGTDPQGDAFTANITGYPNRGNLFQFDGTPFVLPSNCSSCPFVSQLVTDPLLRVTFVPARYDASTNTTVGNTTEVSVYTTFSFTLTNTKLTSNIGLVTLYVIMLPYDPIASNISITIREQDRKTLTLDAVSPNGEDLTYRLLALPTAGSTWQTLNDLNTVGFPLKATDVPIFLVSSSGSIIYESPTNPTSTSAFYFFAYDALVLVRQNRSAIDKQSEIAYINIEVVPVNDPPIAFDQTVEMQEDTIAVITLNGLDPDFGAQIHPIIVDIPLLGSLYQYGNISDLQSLDRIITPFTDVTDPDWRVIYIPAQYDHGSPYTEFTFVYYDGEYDSSLAIATINVLPVNNPPSAKVPRSQRAYEGSDLEIAVGGEDVDGGKIYAYLVNAEEPSFINSGSRLYQAVPVHLGARDALNFTAEVTRGEPITTNCTILTDPNNRLILAPLLAVNNTLGRDTLTFSIQFFDGLLFSTVGTISVLVQKPKTEMPSSYNSKTGVYVGPAVAAVAALLGLALIMVIIWYRNNRMGDDEDYIKLDLFDSEEPDEPEMALEEEPMIKPRGNLENLILDPKYQVLNALLKAIDVTEYDALAKCLIDVFEHHDCTLQMLKYFITMEVEGASSAGTLFRANSIASKMMTAYTKMIGNEYLIVTLKTPIETIIKKDNAMEVDPKKLKQGESRKANMRLLQLACQNFLDWIVSSASNAPMPIRILSNHLFFSVERKFPANKHIAIGGFLFLRFFCPAIISPEGFKVISAPPPPPARRALVLIAKALQNLSNAVLFGKKEEFMIDLNEFISRNMEPLKTYFDSMVSLPPQLPRITSAEIPEERLTAGLSTLLKYLTDAQDKIFDILEGRDGTHSERTDSHSHSTSRSGRSKGRSSKGTSGHGSSKGTSGRTSSHGSSKGMDKSGSERSRSGSRLHQPPFGEDSVTEMSGESELDSFDDGEIQIGDNIFVGEDGVEYVLAPDDHFSDDDEVMFDEQTNFNAFSIEEVGTDTAREIGIPLDDWTNVDELSLEEAWANALSPIEMKETAPDGFNAKGEVIDPVLALKTVLSNG